MHAPLSDNMCTNESLSTAVSGFLRPYHSQSRHVWQLTVLMSGCPNAGASAVGCINGIHRVMNSELMPGIPGLFAPDITAATTLLHWAPVYTG